MRHKMLRNRRRAGAGTLMHMKGIGSGGLEALLSVYSSRLAPELPFSAPALAFRIRALGRPGREAFLAACLSLAESEGSPFDEDDRPEADDIDELVQLAESLARRTGPAKLERLLDGFAADACGDASCDAAGGRDEDAGAGGEIRQRAGEYARIFGVDEAGREILLFAYAMEQCDELDTLYSSVPLIQKPRFLASCLGAPEARVREALATNGSLLRSGLVRRDDDDPLTEFEVSPMLLDGLAGLSGSLNHQRLCTRSGPARFPLEDHPVRKGVLEAARALLDSGAGANILLYGPPGTGKTEFARSLATDRGKTAWFLGEGDESGVKDRRAALALSVASIDPASEILVVDEAESLLSAGEAVFLGSRGGASKSWINGFLEAPTRVIVWIVNWTRYMDESVLRRFELPVRFERFGDAERERAWKAVAKDSGLELETALVKQLSLDYEISAGGIAGAVKLLKLSGGSGDRDRVERMLRVSLDAQADLGGAKLAPGAHLKPRAWDAEALETDIPFDNLERALATWKERRGGSGARGLRMLFWGPPGTGKTEAARALAAGAGLKVVARRASELLDMFVGGTEKRIAEAFREAERDGALLLVDEADSFLRERGDAQRSWEITQVNEFLTRMESFRGALVCTTNLLSELDKAALRRFQVKAEFGALKTGALERLIVRYFPAIVLPEDARSALAPFDGVATPGDLAALADRADYLGAAFGWDELVEGLASECRFRPREKRVGFA